MPYEELGREATAVLSEETYAYAAAGTGTEGTVLTNREAIEHWWIVPRVVRSIEDRALGSEVPSMDLPAPIQLVPIGSQRAYRENAQRASASTAASPGVPFFVNTHSSTSIEVVADVMYDAPWLFQLHCMADFEFTGSPVVWAEQSDYDAVVITVDSPIAKWRIRTPENIYRSSRDMVKANFMADLVFARDIKGMEGRNLPISSTKTRAKLV